MKILDLRDRFARLIISGFSASLILFGLNMFSYYVLHFSNRRYINYAALMVFGRKFNTLLEAVISSIAQIGFATGLFVIFSYFLLKENSKNFIWRGLFIGFGSWFSIMSVNYMMGVHKKLPINAGSDLIYDYIRNLGDFGGLAFE